MFLCLVPGGGRAVKHNALIVAQEYRRALSYFALGNSVLCDTAVEIRRLVVAAEALRTAVSSF